MVMISSEDFLPLAREQLRGLAKTIGLRETKARVGRAFVEITLHGTTADLIFGMDRGDSYRVYAEIALLDKHGLQRFVVKPVSPDDFTRFEMRFVAAAAGATSEDLGDYGSGSATEVEEAIEEVVGSIEHYGMELLRGDQRTWAALQRKMASRAQGASSA